MSFKSQSINDRLKRSYNCTVIATWYHPLRLTSSYLCCVLLGVELDTAVHQNESSAGKVSYVIVKVNIVAMSAVFINDYHNFRVLNLYIVWEERRVLRVNMQCKSWLNQLSLSHESHKKLKRGKQKKNWWASKVPKLCQKKREMQSEKVRETTVGTIYGKGKFWVWSGTEMEWCIVQVVIMMMMMMMMMMNWWEKDEMTVTGTHHQQVGEVL